MFSLSSNMDKEFSDENLLLLLFQLLKFKKLRKSKCKKIYFRCRPPKFWVQNIFNYNLQQNLSFFSTPPGIIYRVGSSHHRCAVKIGVLRNSTKFTGKHLCQISFLIRFQASALQLYLKRDSTTGVFMWILLNF